MAPRPPANPLRLRLAHWPDADRQAWTRAQQPVGLFDDLGPGSDWSAITWSKTTKGYGRYLGWLRHHHPADLALPVAARITKERVAAYVDHMCQTTRGYSAVGYVEDLLRAHRILIPGAAPDWLTTLHGRLRARTRPARDKRAVLPAVDELVGCGEALMRDAELVPDWSARRRAVAYRDGLAIALLAYRPLRLKNFAGLRLGAELRREHGVWQILIPGADIKTGQPYEAPVPAALIPPLEHYLAVHRPVLLAGERHVMSAPAMQARATPAPAAPATTSPASTNALWVSETGTAWEQGAMSQRIARTVAARLGRRIPPHRFRDAAATTIAIDAPRHVRDTHLLLGHATLATTERHYIQAQSLVAGRRHQAMLDSLRSRPHATKAHTATEPQETSACAS